MFFFLSKLFWLFCAPSHLAVELTLAAALLLFLNRVRPARWCACISAAILIGFGVLPFGVWLMQPLENRYPRPDWPAHVDGILVLGADLDQDIFRSRGVTGNIKSEARMVGAYEAARHYPGARVVFAGAYWHTKPQFKARYNVVKHVFLQMGLAPERLLVEDRSMDTWENFVLARHLAKPKPGEIWLLATSAYHLPRAMSIAERAGWKMIAWPTDAMTSRTTHYDYRDIPKNLDRSDWAVHEWIGLLAYRLGRRSGKAET
jgi:uncharacterized SAM-binding protein YcdF (DUF218 family)